MKITNREKIDRYILPAALIVLFFIGAIAYIKANSRPLSPQEKDIDVLLDDAYKNDTQEDLSSNSNRPDIKDFPTQPAASIDYLFEGGRDPYLSGVFGYIGGGAFVTIVPDWMSEHWLIEDPSSKNLILIKPKGVSSYPNRPFSDITIKMNATDEAFNAEALYDSEKNILGPKTVFREILFNNSRDTQIFHVEKIYDDYVAHSFFLNGNGMTAAVYFSGSLENYLLYSQKIKEFVLGLGRGAIEG
jgi:hypothetical protein